MEEMIKDVEKKQQKQRRRRQKKSKDHDKEENPFFYARVKISESTENGIVKSG